MGGLPADVARLETAFIQLSKSDGHSAKQLDVEIGKSITRSPDAFLIVLKKYRAKITRLDALVGNLGPEFVDDFEKQSGELRKRIRALETVTDRSLKLIASECIAELRSQLQVVAAPFPIRKESSTGKAAKAAIRYLGAKHFSGEVVPGYEVSLTFKVAHCPISSVLPTVREFESQISLNSVETGKPASVRIVHLYLFDNLPIEDCSVQAGDRFVEINHRIAPHRNRMTHYFITISEGSSIERLQTVKPVE